jgi:regulator of CtrA degradation
MISTVECAALKRNPAFFNGTYNETMVLLVEARNYMTNKAPAARMAVAEDKRLMLSCESLRITCRLTQVMAWVLAQRAAHTGEISSNDLLGDEFQLGGTKVCLDTSLGEAEELPKGVRSLLERSYNLYTRVRRLDQLMRAKSA